MEIYKWLLHFPQKWGILWITKVNLPHTGILNEDVPKKFLGHFLFYRGIFYKTRRMGIKRKGR